MNNSFDEWLNSCLCYDVVTSWLIYSNEDYYYRIKPDTLAPIRSTSLSVQPFLPYNLKSIMFQNICNSV